MNVGVFSLHQALAKHFLNIPPLSSTLTTYFTDEDTGVQRGDVPHLRSRSVRACRPARL